MPNAELFALGAIAGFTIYLGLPLAFMNATARMKGILNSMAAGILIFLLVDIMHDAMNISEKPMLNFLGGSAQLAEGSILPAVLFAGFSAGLLGLVWFEAKYLWTVKNKNIGERRAKRLAMMIAAGIGLHNFSEGLAIGQSYSSGAMSLAITLAVGFGLHNMTEGFGIAAPLSGFKVNKSYIILLGLIGGGPTFLGAIIGSFWISQAASVFFLSMSGGAIVYVIKEMLYHGKIAGEGFNNMFALVAGFMLGFLTLVMVHYGTG